MTNVWSAKSRERLATCAPDLVLLFNAVLPNWDCTIIEGHRSLERHEELFAAGKSRVKRSKHCDFPSIAVDVAPWPIDWNDEKRFYAFGGFVLGVAAALNISIRWGGDWNCNRILTDQHFNDLVHFELLTKARKGG